MSAFVKTFRGASPAKEAVRRSTALRRQGLATPRAEIDGTGVSFQYIDGQNGAALTRLSADLWLAPLVALHGCVLDRLAPFDPLRRIRPRRDMLTDVSLQTALDRLARSIPTGGALVHGDFHLGQVIRDDNGRCWLIDLDDLALGPVEADLGNLIANLATQERLPGSFATRVAQWRKGMLGAWQTLGQHATPAKVDHFTALALIRRHLKLREQGRHDFETEIREWVIPVACRTSPSCSAAYPG